MNNRTPAPYAEWETITPDIAKIYLGANDGNRIVKLPRVERYKADMIAGRWHLTGEPIQFDINGRLINGQHRLHAIIAADVPVRILVVRGLDIAAQEHLDQGVARGAADALRIAGVGHYVRLASTAVAILGHDRGYARNMGGRKLQNTATNAEVLEYVRENHESLLDTVKVMDTAVRGNSWLLSPAMATALCYIMERRDREKAREFWCQFLSGSNACGTVNCARNLFINTKLANRRIVFSDQILYICNAWKNFLHGKESVKVARKATEVWL